MKKIIYLSLFISTAIFTSCADSKGGQAQENQAKGPQPFPVIEVPTRTVTGYTSYPTSIEGVVNSEVRAKVPGYITDVLIDAGAKVKKGQLLFKLETESLSGDAAAAKANVNAAKVEVEKLKPLVEKDIISPVQLETAKAQLAQAEANYNSIAANIDYANIKSPIDGQVGNINFRNGALVSPGDPTPLTTVSQTDEVYAFFSMNEKNFLSFMNTTEANTMEEKIENLPEINLVLANGMEFENKGTIETISGEINQQTGTVTFRAKFDNSNGLLRNGSSGTVRIPEVYEDAVIVPTLSTFEQQGKTFVYRVKDDSSLVASSIVILEEVNKVYVVKEGIEKGSIILAKGANKVKPGTKIQPQPITLDSIVNSFNTVFK
ncbi:efflux RND transporter periplasmic adaptor subunit [Salegentibacter sp. JZCK2]|uniref:efflux RND transporter periplasmic adaptor subunit n=1 Tax=Salegentibacter tibetensis TaxID=2873600 RepID=UPI001CD032B5|nr:efflux RND transporter periplasmic adaptor subunit [Salegentibacter tibetensis]MBZ9730257.1 efflux RND transporter periplasmic adaptor subunit [Salegentibacter tibetensis]